MKKTQLFCTLLLIVVGLQSTTARGRKVSRSRQFLRRHLQMSLKDDCLPVPPRPEPVDDITKLGLWELLAKTEEQLVLDPVVRDYQIFLGLTGSGKSVITQLTAGNSSDLFVYVNEKGDTVVADSSGKIGSSTTSQTLIPDFVNNPSVELAEYDMPGFLDNRGSKMDITFNYLMKKVLDHASSTKLIFVSTYDYFKDTRLDKLRSLARAAALLITDVSKMEPAIGMIVNMVPPVTDRGVPLTDEMALKIITSTLQDLKHDLESQLNSVRRRMLRDERELKDKEISWINSLLQDGKLALMRIALVCGPLLNDPTMIQVQSNLRDFLKNHVSFIGVDGPTDFDYSLAEGSLNAIDGLVDDTNNNITNINVAFVKAELALKNSKSEALTSFTDLATYWKDQEYPKISKTLAVLQGDIKISNSPYLSGLVWQDALGPDQLIPDYLKAMNLTGGYLDFFDAMSHKQHGRDVDRWLKPFSDWSATLQKKRDWYDFLQSTQKNFDTFNFHQTRPNVDSVPDDAGVDYLMDTLKLSVPANILDIFRDGSTLSPNDKLMLTNMLKTVLDKTVLNCNPPTLTVTGGYILASSFVDGNGKWRCDNPSSISTITVLASQALFLNVEINPDNSLMQELYIISPRIEKPDGMKGTITMIGRNGDQPSPSRAASGGNPRGAGANGNGGTAGVPGSPGYQGGLFYALTNYFKSPTSPLLILDGGSGGDGQAGGNGSGGNEGEADNMGDWPSPCDYCDGCLNEAKRFTRYDEKGGMFGGGSYYVYMAGSRGGSGGNGADGGVPGKGGLAGMATITQLDKSQQASISVQANQGGSGRDGGSGSKGSGALEGVGHQAELHHSSGGAGMKGQCEYLDKKNWDHDRPRGSDGYDGRAGANSAGEKPQPTHTFSREFPAVIADFKTYSLSKQEPYFPNSFLNVIEQSGDVRSLYKPKTFAYELLALETLALSITDDIKKQSLVAPYYHSFLERISEYSNNVQLTDQDKKVLATLYTSGVAQTRVLAPPFGSSIIINVAGYFKSLLDQFEQFKVAQSTVIVDAERDKYLDTFVQKINQVMSFMNDTVQPAIEASRSQLDYTTNELVTEVEEVLKAAEIEEKARRKLYEKFKSTMGQRMLMNILTIGGSALSLLGPEGAAIGGLIAAGANIGNLALNDTSVIRPPINVPDAVKNQAEFLQLQILLGLDTGEDVESAKQLLSFSKDMKSQNPDAIDDGIVGKYTKLDEVITTYENEGQKSSDINTKIQQRVDIQVAAADLDTAVNARGDELQAKINSTSTPPEEKKKAQDYKNIIDNIKAVTALINTSVDTFKKIIASGKMLDTLATLAAEAKKDVEEIKTYQASITNSLMPMIDQIFKDVANATGSSAGSQVSIAVKKWQIQGHLNDFKFYLQLFTKGFKTSDLFQHVIDRLIDGTDMMMDLYDFIAQFQDQMQLADYLANINSPNALRIVIDDPETLEYINKIQCSVQASILLAEYKKASAAFQQWVYPFADVYVGDMELPSGLQKIMDPGSQVSDSNTTTFFILPMIESNVIQINQYLEDYKNLIIPTMDRNLIKQNFSSDYISSHPFFVWDRGQYANVIQSFIKGQPVALSAQPDYSFSRGKEAVKFRVAELIPKCRDPEHPERDVKLQAILKRYAITMNHSGLSRYSYMTSGERQDVTMVGESVPIYFHYERDSSGNRVGRNAVYDKIKQGDYILSPYTLWTFQLSVPQVRPGWADLNQFADCMELELQGEGTFVLTQSL